MSHKKTLGFIVPVLIVAGVLLLATEPALGIPAFARKYQTSCQTCHIAYPKLNAFGVAFRNNGYRFPSGDEDSVKDEPVLLGAPAWKRVWPDGVWPADIPGMPPVAAHITNSYVYREGTEGGVSNEFILPETVELFAGGTIGEDVSFYGAITLLEQNEFGGLHRVFGQFDRVGGNPLFNVRLGGFEPRAVPFSNHRKLMKTNYLVNDLSASIDLALTGDVEIGSGHGGGHGSTFFNFSSAQRGIEFWGANSGPGGGGLEWAFGVVNGNGLGGFTFTPPEEHGDEHGGEHDEHANEHGAAALGILPLQDEHEDEMPGEHGDEHGIQFLDNNSSKDIYWRLAYKFGGFGLTGKSGPGADQPVAQTNNWVDNSFRIGTFGARGTGQGGANFLDEEDFIRAGVDFDLWYQDLNLFGAWMWGRNERRVHDDKLEFEMHSWFVEADYVLLPWVVPALRYEVTDFDPLLENGVIHEDLLPRIRRWVPHVTFLIRSNVKFVFESNHFMDDLANDVYLFNFDFAF